MKKVRFSAIIILILALIVLVLFLNRQKSRAQIAQNVALVPTVSVIAVGKQDMSQDLSLTGTVEANLDVMVVSETVGRVTAVHTHVGDHVNAGSVLVSVDDELKLAGYKTAEVNYEKSQKDLKRYEDLFKSKSVTENEIEAARLACKAAEAQYLTARRQYNDTRIKSPISGVVTSRMVDRGHMVSPGTPIANVVDISKLKVTVNVAESDVFKLKTGDKVKISTDIYPGVTFEGKIDNISSKSDESHTYRVEIRMENSAEHPLKAGMFARLTFPAIARKTARIIPRECLVGSRRNPQVFVVEKGVAKRREITLGAEIGTKVEVISGLSEGETVVLSGQNNLVEGSSVNTVPGSDTELK
ncbi:MAG: efflux RND transporter periplasmic adaptor subunit [Candidatus Omnitrophota bacterium]